MENYRSQLPDLQIAAEYQVSESHSEYDFQVLDNEASDRLPIPDQFRQQKFPVPYLVNIWSVLPYPDQLPEQHRIRLRINHLQFWMRCFHQLRNVVQGVFSGYFQLSFRI